MASASETSLVKGSLRGYSFSAVPSRPVTSRETRDNGAEILDLLAAGNPAAFATDSRDHIVFWNRGAEKVLGRGASQVLGRRCFDIMRGHDVFGNRYCHEQCTVVSMTRKGEPVQGFEMVVCPASGREQRLHVTILQVPGSRPDLFTLIHLLQPIDESGRLARALERGGATTPGSSALPVSPTPSTPAPLPDLTDREKEILRWVAAGFQNKDVAQKLGISLATVRNHIHNVLEKLGVHSKLEAISLAFRQGWVAPAGDPPER